jgi:hypothetical protein
MIFLRKEGVIGSEETHILTRILCPHSPHHRQSLIILIVVLFPAGGADPFALK